MTEETLKPFPNEPSQADWTYWGEWEKAADNLRRQHPDVTVFETKALYTFGMMRHLLEASGWMLEHGLWCKDGKCPNPRPFYFPVYLLACGAVELMGRCVMEEKEPTEYQRALRRGLERTIEVCSHCGRSKIRGEYSKASREADESHIVVSADGHTYTIGDCIRFRNFMAHGMADLKGRLLVTSGFVGRFICRAAQGVDRYYRALGTDTPDGEELRKRFVRAKVLPLWDANGPLHAHHLYEPLIQPPCGTPCGELLHERSWRRYCPG